MQLSRYDDQTPWFLDYSAGWTSTSAPFLPTDLTGSRVLDLACGAGPLSRELARRGAQVVGVELASPLLEHARQSERVAPLGIEYAHGDASRLGWWDRVPFDGLVCNMALMDIDDLHSTLSTIGTVLKPGGWFNLSLLHPCYPGDGENALPSWPPEAGYGAEGWWITDAAGVRGHVGANHRKLSTYVNAILAAHLRLTQLTEPDPALPRILIIDGRRPE